MSRVVVVGDALLDRDVLGTVDRLCPDAPAPVVDERHSIERPGGAGLAATLAAGSGAEVSLVAAIGADHAGRTIRRLLAEHGVDVARWRDPACTVEKERVHVQGRPIVRVDRGVGARQLPPPPPTVAELISGADAVLVSDYGRGVAADELVRRSIVAAAEHGTPVVWDPHPRGGAVPPRRVALATPNVAEVLEFDRPSMTHRSPTQPDLESLLESARRVRGAWAVGALAVTRGPSGAMLVTGDGVPLVVPVESPVVGMADTCGAGDAFAAACAVALAGGSLLSDAVQAGVQRASAFVAAGGALALGRERPASARPPTEHEPGTCGARVVATGGCFDLLHAGHVATLQRARLLGDRLVVLLNGDASVRRLKGPGRPLQPAADRAAVLRSLSCVDDVIVFDEDTPVSALRRLRPAVFVKGGDYSSARIPESEVLREWGGVVVTVPYLAGRSTTGIVDQIGAAHVV